MKIENIIIGHCYLPGSAASNRVFSFAKGYHNIGKNVTVILHSGYGVIPPVLEGVKIVNVQEKNIPGKLLRKLLIMRPILNAFKKNFVVGKTSVHIYRTPYWAHFLSYKKYNKFYERGEVPFYAEKKSPMYLLKEYLSLWEIHKAMGLLAQTYALKDFYAAKGVKNIDVSNMIVDPSRFNIEKQDNGQKYIAYCGTVSKHKDGVDDLIKAFAIFHEKHPEYLLKIIGGFVSEYDDKEELFALRSSLGLEDSVVFTGRVSREEMPEYLMNASMLALARPDNIQARYGFPTKVGEYLCTGNPVVLTKVGELPMYFTDKVNCLLADPDKPESFAESLGWLASHESEGKVIGKNGRDMIDKFFSQEGQAQRAIEFMERTLNGGG